MDSRFAGVIPVDKPPGVTSRRVVDIVARAAGTRACGHAGTLDPLASGVVVVCLGAATRLVDLLHEQPKAYEAEFLLGRSSPSDDLETEVVVEPSPRVPTPDEVEGAAATLRGDILQRPCDYSAVHVGGQRAYRLARKGRPVAVAPRPVHVSRLGIVDWEWPSLKLDIECSSGTFVRALGRDLAGALGTGAVMVALRRTRVGPFTLSGALPLDDVSPESLAAAVRPPLDALPALPVVRLAGAVLDRAVRGGLLEEAEVTAEVTAEDRADGGASGRAAAIDPDGALVGILARLERGTWRLRPNFRGAG